MSAVNQSGWRPEMGDADGAGTKTFTGNRALMLEEALIFEIGSTDTTGVDFDQAPPLQGRGLKTASAVSRALRRSGSPVCPNPKLCATIRACRARTTPSTLACSRSALAR
ncbi:hypothetical protein SPHINGOAX6_70153 [Sphingomonas sp. AX6]|nr:hypothetical protein SPHINGOAX6_70153 [Sphingomonas sp. AX6]